MTLQAQRDVVADGIATALLGGVWTARAMAERTARALDRRNPPAWVTALVAQVLEAYVEPPVDRPRELAAYLQTRPAWELAWNHRRPPRIVHWQPVPTRVAVRPWPVAELPDVAALARLLDLDVGEVAWFADVRCLERTVPEPLRHYRWRTMPKRGGHRLLAAPKSRLKEVQHRLLRHVLDQIPLHDAAHGGVRGRSVRTAVAPHVGKRIVIRADLETFFACVPAGRIWNLLRVAGLPEAVAHTTTGLVTTVVPRSVWRSLPSASRVAGRRFATPHLPQGAPTSPALANLVAYSLDRRLTGLAQRFGARYTRYVDDLTFSGGSSLRNARSRFVELVDAIVRADGFRLNAPKTVALGSSGRQQVLGAVMNDHPSIPRHDRDALQAVLHNCAVHGWRGQARGRADFPSYLLGRVSWVGGLDPEFGARLRLAYDSIDWT